MVSALERFRCIIMCSYDSLFAGITFDLQKPFKEYQLVP